jgi:hypothetical protein
MTYTGRVERGVVILDGPERPREGAIVRVVEEESESHQGGSVVVLAGQLKWRGDAVAEQRRLRDEW